MIKCIESCSLIKVSEISTFKRYELLSDFNFFFYLSVEGNK